MSAIYEALIKVASMSYSEARDILGVAHNSTPEEINYKYRQLAKKYHPDLNRDPEANAMTVAINAAKEILLNPEKDLTAFENQRDVDRANEIIDRKQKEAEDWIHDIRTQRAEWDDYSAGKINFKDLIHPANIDIVRKYKEQEKEYKKQQRKNKIDIKA